MNPLVYIIIVNWNGEDVIVDCLKSLSKINYNNYKILIVDNNSSDNSIVAITENSKNVNILELDKNYGFADGNNKGVESILTEEPEYLIFLNNDTEVDPNFIEPLITRIGDDTNVGQTVPKIMYSNRRNTIWYAGGKVNLWKGQIKHIGIRQTDSDVFVTPQETDYATGCCFAIRTKDYIGIGGFDSSYPMYCEDVDLSIRIRSQGKKVVFVPGSKIYHKVSTSIGGEYSFRKFLKQTKGYRIVFWRYTNVIQKITVLIYWLFSAPLKFIRLVYLKIVKND